MIKRSIYRAVAFFVLVFIIAFKISAQETKSEDLLNGPKKEYFPNGKVSKEYTLSNGVINGSYRAYSEKGYLLTEQNMVEGVPHGYYRTFFENGQLQSEANMENGVPQGMKKEYFENGTLKAESYLTGEPWEYSGYTNLFYEDGKKKSESKVSAGKLVIAIHYDKEGRVTSEQTEGQIISYSYDRDGKKHTSINGVPQK